jgi:hypothetical protein
VATGDLHSLWLNGELQIRYTDTSSPYTTGTAIALVAGGMNARFRLLSICGSTSVTVRGLTPGLRITFRAPGGVPVEDAIVTGRTYTTTNTPHFPLDTISYGGIDSSFTTTGLIWGGDEFILSDPTAGLSHTKDFLGINRPK